MLNTASTASLSTACWLHSLYRFAGATICHSTHAHAMEKRQTISAANDFGQPPPMNHRELLRFVGAFFFGASSPHQPRVVRPHLRRHFWVKNSLTRQRVMNVNFILQVPPPLPRFIPALHIETSPCAATLTTKWGTRRRWEKQHTFFPVLWKGGNWLLNKFSSTGVFGYSGSGGSGVWLHTHTHTHTLRLRETSLVWEKPQQYFKLNYSSARHTVDRRGKRWPRRVPRQASDEMVPASAGGSFMTSASFLAAGDNEDINQDVGKKKGRWTAVRSASRTLSGIEIYFQLGRWLRRLQGWRLFFFVQYFPFAVCER